LGTDPDCRDGRGAASRRLHQEGSAAGAPERHRREFPAAAWRSPAISKLVVRLPSNPTTGYRWSLAQQSTAVLEPEGAPSYEKGAGDAGAGGIEIWRFAPTQAGEGTLRLEYRRLWEADAAPRAGSSSYKVTVRE